MRSTALGIVLTLLIGLSVAAHPVAAQANVTTPTDNAPRSVMVQMSTWSNPATLSSALSAACSASNPLDATRDLVLTDVATLDVNDEPQLLAALIDAAMPFFPGSGSGCTFDRVFVGTIDVTSKAPGGNPYRDGVRDVNFTQWMRVVSREVAELFSAHVAASAHRNAEWNWYVSFEGMLNYWGDTTAAGNSTVGRTVASAYSGYLRGHASDLDNVRANAQLLWSPGFDIAAHEYSSGTAPRVQLDETLRHVTDAVPGLILDLQDHVGSTDCTVRLTPMEAVTWFEITRAAAPSATVRMNVELFRRTDPGNCSSALVPDFSSAVAARTDYYREHDVPIGAAFELRYQQAYTATTAVKTSILGSPRLEFSAAGSIASVSGRLVDDAGVALANKRVQLISCDGTWGSCRPLSPTKSSMTDANGIVSIAAPALSASANLRLAYTGDSDYRSSEGDRASFLLPGAGTTAVTWAGIRATPAAPGQVSSVTARLAVASVGWPMTGADVVLVGCASAVSCDEGTPIATGKAAADGSVSIATRALVATPAHFQLRFLGNARYAPSNSAIASISAAGSTTVAWNEVTASTIVGASSTVTATLKVANVGWPMVGADVLLFRCASVVTCADGEAVDAGVVASDGTVAIAATALGTGPAYFQLRFLGNNKYAPQSSPIVWVAAAGQTAVSWSQVGATASIVGSSSIVSGTLKRAGVGWPMAGAEVVLVRCSTAIDCTAGEAVGVGTVAGDGVVAVATPLLTSLPAHFQLAFLGNSTYAPAASAITSIRSPGATPVTWSDMSVTPQTTGGANTVSGALKVTDVGWPMVGANVVLMQCASVVSCERATPVVLGVAAAGGAVAISVPAASTTPAHYQLRFLGNDAYSPQDSAIVTVAARGSTIVSWSQTSATPAAVGAVSVVSGVLKVSVGGWAMVGADVALVQCASATNCTGGMAVAAGVVTADGSVNVATPSLAAVPAYFRLEFYGNANYAPQASPIVQVSAPPG